MTGVDGERGCLPLPFTSPGDCTDSEPPAPAGRALSDRAKSTGVRDNREA